jgi:hypothetical protein
MYSSHPFRLVSSKYSLDYSYPKFAGIKVDEAKSLSFRKAARRDVLKAFKLGAWISLRVALCGPST